MEDFLTSFRTAQIQPFSQCVNSIVRTAHYFSRSRLVKRHGNAALKAERCGAAAEINLPKCRVRELAMKKG